MRYLLPSHSPHKPSYPIQSPFPSTHTNQQKQQQVTQISPPLLSSPLHLLQPSTKLTLKMALFSPATFPATAIFSSLNASMKKKAIVTQIEGLNSYGGLKAQNSISSIGIARCADESFAMVVNSIRRSPPSIKKQKSRGGGAFSSTCNAAAEIFKIAAVMNGLVLVGVAFGFILLRVEAFVEESE